MALSLDTGFLLLAYFAKKIGLRLCSLGWCFVGVGSQKLPLSITDRSGTAWAVSTTACGTTSTCQTMKMSRARSWTLRACSEWDTGSAVTVVLAVKFGVLHLVSLPTSKPVVANREGVDSLSSRCYLCVNIQRTYANRLQAYIGGHRSGDESPIEKEKATLCVR